MKRDGPLAALVGEFSRGVMVEAYLADVVGMREHCGLNCGSLAPRIGNVVNASYSYSCVHLLS